MKKYEQYWYFRLQVDFFTNKKIVKLIKRNRHDMIVCFLAICSVCVENNRFFMSSPNEYYDIYEFALDYDFEDELVEDTLEYFVNIGYLEHKQHSFLDKECLYAKILERWSGGKSSNIADSKRLSRELVNG